MMKLNRLFNIGPIAMASLLLAAPLFLQASTKTDGTPAGIAKAVRHELLMLPYYNIFDDLGFHLDGSTVTLYGHVLNPVLKSDAGNVVKRIEGVSRVVNDIEVLPLSPMDMRIRFAEARAIYGFAPLNRYALGALPPIHIIVKNGNVTLEGVVLNQADKTMAGIRANGVPGVFKVTNNLQVEKS
ncbi:MAG TPA: BON domain-containing protein [Bryobacteraceae bacterium]|nr:BON domain-containing protein [Bryobacteraceae bacterium]